jgi:O-antigen/teichoic acid export membrane protein
VLPFSLLLALFVSTIVFSSSYPHGIFLWGLNALRFSAISMALVAVSSIVVKLMIIPSLGSAGAAWGTASCYLVFATLPNLYYSGRLLKRTLVVQNDGESAHIRRD